MPLTTSDIVEIQQLAVRYCQAIDSGDGETVAALFVEDGVLNALVTVQGHAALVEFGNNGPVRRPRPRHVLSDVLVDGDGDGDTATVRAYVHLYSQPDGAPLPTLAVAGVNVDTVRRENGTWRFVTKSFTVDGAG